MGKKCYTTPIQTKIKMTTVTNIAIIKVQDCNYYFFLLQARDSRQHVCILFSDVSLYLCLMLFLDCKFTGSLITPPPRIC